MTQAQSFGERNFAHAQLGDLRRTKRLVQLVDQMCLRPGGTLPQKFRSPADLQAFYRLMRKEDVTHEAILAAHRQATLEHIGSLDTPVLILHDTTELEYTTHKSLDGLGPIGNGQRRGYITHNSLAVDPQTRDVLGLCHQVLHCRAKAPKSATQAQKKKRRSRESRLWIQGTERLPRSWQLVDVCDRGADTSEFLKHEVASGRRFVIRSSSDRCLLLGHGPRKESESGKLRAYARSLPPAGTWKLPVTSKAEMRSPRRQGKKTLKVRKKRTANMAVAFAPVQITPSAGGCPPLKVWLVRVWEIDPPAGEERLEWFLLTNEPVHSFEDAYRVVGWYECRWIIETNFAHLKITMKMDVLHCETVAGVQKELLIFALVYNLIRLVMLAAAEQQGVPVARVSFIDALRWLDEACHHRPALELVINSDRRGRNEPRVKKRRAKEYPLMKLPRDELRKQLLHNRFTA